MTITKKKLEKYQSTVEEFGVDEAARKLGVSRETVRRTIRHARNQAAPKASCVKTDALLTQIGKRFNHAELEAIAKGHRLTETPDAPRHNFTGKTVTIGVLSDTHIGSKYTDTRRIKEAFSMFRKAGVDMVVHPGDVTEGMSHRAGHVYELVNIGYAAQKKAAVEALSEWKDTPLYVIDGNHDRWFIKSNGAVIVQDICQELQQKGCNAVWLGHDQGRIDLSPNVHALLWHGEDGAGSYALSYRPQKIVESLKGGEKPGILITGHDHKAGYFFIRNVHVIESGSIQSQTSWMRGKRLAAHEGFWLLRATINETGIVRFAQEFFPYYD